MAHLESLVVLDGSPPSRQVLAFGFERDGFKVHATGDPLDALGIAKTRAPQLVVASAAGDAEEAIDFVGKLRGDPGTRDLPIVVVGERPARERALHAGADEFVARPAYLRDVLTLSKLAVALRQDADEAGLSGLLEDYELYFLVRAFGAAGRSGVLELERARRTGELCFADGELIAARCGGMAGVPAFHHLLLWGQASMHLKRSSPAGPREISLPVEPLLEQAAKFALEFEAMAGRIGGPEAVYRQVPRRAVEVRGQIPPEVMGLLKHYDGRRPFIDVVEDSPFKAFDTIKITHRLSELGVLERIEPDDLLEAPLTAQLAVRDWLLGTAVSERVTVTEAGRRAAEAYAAEAERRAEEPPPSPSADLFQDTDRQPKAPVEPQLSKKQKKKLQAAQANAVRRDAAPAAKVDPGEAERTVPFTKLPFETPAPPPAPTAKHPSFTDEEEQFFAAAEQLAKVDPVESFDDLDSGPQPKRSGWFPFAPKSK